MLSDDKTAALESFLGNLPKAAALRLARTVEIDALNDGSLPHDAILSLLRPSLRVGSSAPRTMSPLRAFCRPFEDLLSSGLRKDKCKGCLSRSTILPVWNWLKRDLIPEAVADYVGDYKSFMLADEPDSAEQCIRGFWQLAGEAITDAVAADPDLVGERLGGESFVLDAEEMGLLLTAGPLMTELQTLLPKPTRSLSDTQVDAFRQLYDRVAAEAPDAAPFLPVAAMGRLEKSWQALRLAQAVSRRHGVQRSVADLGLVGEILFCRMENAREDIHAFRPGDFDAEALLDRLTDFALLSSAVGAEIDVLRSGRWGKRLVADRAAVAGIMRSYLAHALGEIAAALPLKRCAGGKRSLVPDFTVAIDEAKTVRALANARLICGCRYLAAAASFADAYAEARDAAVDLIRFYDSALAEELADASPDTRAVIEGRFAIAVALSQIVIGQRETDLLLGGRALSRAA